MRTLLFTIAILGVMSINADDSLDGQISRLILAIETSNCQFVRNGKTYTPEESMAHVSKKYRYFKDDIDSVAKFIELSATKSLISGRPYQVQCGTSEPELASTWFTAKVLELGIVK
jgi:hypothetical protein